MSQGFVNPLGPQGGAGLTGPTGPTGPQGSTGPSGSQGVSGLTGSQGVSGVDGGNSRGLTGPSGPDGLCYRPPRYAVSGNTGLSASDSGAVIEHTGTSIATVTLPDPPSDKTYEFTILKTGNGSLTINMDYAFGLFFVPGDEAAEVTELANSEADRLVHLVSAGLHTYLVVGQYGAWGGGPG